jgi:hypothetical protein
LWKKIYATHLILPYILLETIQRSEDTGEKRNPYRILRGPLKDRDLSEDLGVEGGDIKLDAKGIE